MQRLLRGSLLYVLLTGLVIIVYTGTNSVQIVTPADSMTPAAGREALAWWPEQLDQDVLAGAITRRPGLGMALSLLTLLMVGLGFGGIGLFGWSLWTGRIRTVFRFPPIRLPSWSFGELGRLILLILLVASLLPFLPIALRLFTARIEFDRHLWITSSMLVLDIFVVLAVLAFAEIKGRPVRQTFGFSRRRVANALRVGLRGYVALFPWLFAALFIVVEAARVLGFTPPPEPIQELIFNERRAGVLGLTVLLACAVGPVAEEFFFRGVLYASLRKRLPRAVAMGLSGAAFALIHQNAIGFLPITMLGCLLAYLYERTGSLAAPMAVHILHNSLLMSMALIVKTLVAGG